MYALILFSLGKITVHDGVHMDITLFCDLIKDGRQVVILVLKKPWYRTRPQPFLRHAFTDVVQIWHTYNE